MVFDVDMLGADVVFWIVCKCDGALVIAVDDVLVVDIVADFSEEAEEPDLLLESVEESHIFRFCVGEGDCWLFLRRIGDCTACKGANKS